MPPPVESGEAPMNMMMIMASWEICSVSARSKLLKPAVRQEMEVKQEFASCSGRLSVPIVLGLLHSTPKISKVPARIRMMLETMTSFV